MFALIASLRIDPANAEEFERNFETLATWVRANEPDTIVYNLARSREEAGVYKVVEIYRSEAALKPHIESEAFQRYRPQMIAMLLEAPVVERMDVAV